MNTRKKIIAGADWGGFLLLAAAFFVIVNYLSYRHYRRFDWTSSGNYTLSDQAVKTLKGLKSDIEVTVLLPVGDDSYDKVNGLLQSFRGETPKIKLDLLDPEKDRERYELALKKYSVTTTNAVVFDGGERSKWVEKDQFVEYDFSQAQYGGQPKISAFKGESAFINAILEVVDPRRPKVYFTVGHGERRELEQGNKGISLFRERLVKEGAEVEELQTASAPSVPPDASLVVVAGPQKPFSPAEADALTRYFEGGGGLFLLLDPVVEEGKELKFGTTGLEGLLKKCGIEPEQAIVVDPRAALMGGGAQTFLGGNYSPHPVTDDISRNKYPLLFVLARSLKTGDPEDPGLRTQALVSTTPEAWGETNLRDLKDVRKDPGDPGGEMALAAASWAEEKPGRRMIVVGDSDAVSDMAFLSQVGGNSIFALNAVRFLLRMEERISIPPKEIKSSPILLTSNQLLTNFVLIVIIFPFLAAVAGVFVHFGRRR